jgi:hypothetical protein
MYSYEVKLSKFHVSLEYQTLSHADINWTTFNALY